MIKLEEGKEKFLNRYNFNRTIEKALVESIKVSVGRNSTYSTDIENSIKKQIHIFWKDKLKDYSKKYKENVSREVYINDVLTLKQNMNEKFPNCFNHPKYKNDKGFRIAHAQKSLSVYLKHLWCLDLINEPPMCPIDNIILTKIGLKYPQNTWGHLNNKDEFLGKSKGIVDFANRDNLSVCMWELFNF